MSNAPDTANPLTGPFWKAAQERTLLLPHCSPCARLIWYPESCCPHCGGELQWRTVSGKGTLAAFSIVHRPLVPNAKKWAPYVPALVSLNEDPGVRLVTQLIDCEPDKIVCDMPVEVVFRPLELPEGEEYIAPLFVPL